MSKLIPIARLSAVIESRYGWRPSRATIFRWLDVGVCHGSVKLKAIRRGARRYTSIAAVRRFMMQQTKWHEAQELLAIGQQELLQRTTPAVFARDQKRAERELLRMKMVNSNC
jgi:hypothetical protein